MAYLYCKAGLFFWLNVKCVLQKPIGIIALLDEAWYKICPCNFSSLFSFWNYGYNMSLSWFIHHCSMFPKSTHQTFTNKLFQNFRGHPRLEKAKFYETDFTISHYAGKACQTKRHLKTLFIFSLCSWRKWLLLLLMF